MNEKSAKTATVVVGVDGTEPSLHALRQAVKVAIAIDQEIVVSFVRQLPPVIGDETGDVIEVYEESLDEAEKLTKEKAGKILADTGVTWRMDVRDGDPGRDLVEVAHDVGASLVVVGAKMHGSVKSLVLSSVASYLMHHCDVSFTVIRPEPEVDEEHSPKP